MRYIDVDALLEELQGELDFESLLYTKEQSEWFKKGLKCAVRDVKYQPTADVAEVRHGKWTLHKDGSGTCSECKKTQKNVWDYNSWQNYCGHCGARMDGDEE